MCTVTFFPDPQGVIITSNRDEQPGRASHPPVFHHYNNRRVVYPKEPAAGGTWFVLDSDGRAAVLMNGGFEKHVCKPPYRRRRGLLLLDFFTGEPTPTGWDLLDTEGIEPFTMIYYTGNRLDQFVWDGGQKHHQELDCKTSHIWSSSPLYGPGQRETRGRWFAELLAKGAPTPDALLQFHARTGSGQQEELVIDRGFIRTVSITQARLFAAGIIVRHVDLINRKTNVLRVR